LDQIYCRAASENVVIDNNQRQGDSDVGHYWGRR
jgi:hypothetical protein